MTERRRAGRINARLWTKVQGVDTDWLLRRTNISVTGIFLELDREVGEPGSVQELHIMALGRTHQVELMSRVVRVFSTNDIWRGSAVAGVAFDFMLVTPDARLAIENLVRHLLETRQESRSAVVPAGVDFNYAATVQGEASATVQHLGGGGMLLQTGWPAQIGEIIRCEVSAPTSKQTFLLEGEVVNIVAESHVGVDTDVHQVEVRFRQPPPAAPAPTPDMATGPESAAQGSIGDAIDALLEEAVFHPPDAPFAIPNEHLRGHLARIRLASLLSFFEIERLTGILKLTDMTQVASIHMRDGRVLAAELAGHQGSQLQLMQNLLEWRQGMFEFTLCDVHCEDRITMATTHLLLRLATAADEQR